MLRHTARGQGKIDTALGPLLARLGEIVAALSTEELARVTRFLHLVVLGVEAMAATLHRASVDSLAGA